MPTLLRSYPATDDRTISCKIWEAARATSAAPTFFERIAIGEKGMEVEYVDGGMGCNNPTNRVLQEAERVFPRRDVACVISVGTGRKETISVKRPKLWEKVVPLSAINAVRAIATDCETTAQDVASRFKSRPYIYFRFSVENGMQSIKMDKWEKLGDVTHLTDQYLELQHVKDQLNAAVSVIRAASRNIPVTQLCT
jgi:predicted acylesterase/phospholipase RssA